MSKINLKLEKLGEMFPASWNEEQKAKGKTLFLKYLSEKTHKYYGGKIQIAPKAPVLGFNWFNVWYTPEYLRSPLQFAITTILHSTLAIVEIWLLLSAIPPGF
jgi:hypothetical protein